MAWGSSGVRGSVRATVPGLFRRFWGGLAQPSERLKEGFGGCGAGRVKGSSCACVFSACCWGYHLGFFGGVKPLLLSHFKARLHWWGDASRRNLGNLVQKNRFLEKPTGRMMRASLQEGFGRSGNHRVVHQRGQHAASLEGEADRDQQSKMRMI